MMKSLLGCGIAVSLVGCVTADDQVVTEAASPVTTADLLSRQNGSLPNYTPVGNAAGWATTVSTQGAIDLGNEFFQDLGTNGRRCISCHLPAAGWGINPEEMQATFDRTNGGVTPDQFGLGAAFRLNDGANSPKADVSTLEARRKAYSMLLTKGLIRVGIGIPANAEFDLIAVDDPYGYASAAELSLFRRPLPSTNLKFLSTVMWDGRETFAGKSIHFDLSDQSNGATLGHAAATNSLTEAQRESIVAFETALHSAQEFDNSAAYLNAAGASGGTDAVIDQEFYIGINDLFGDSKTGAAFDPVVFDIYDAWTNNQMAARAQIARGQALFNTKRINIAGVSGINDEDAFGKPAVVPGTCTSCHDTPNAGNHSVAAPLDIGLVTKAMRTPDMPLYTLRNKKTREVKQVTDPGRALISGRWKDIGRFKGPILRSLSSRAPYFHNGSAASLAAVVDFYDTRFGIGLTAQEKADMVAFLRTL
jgi:cytochrome c peroxidase